MYLTLITLPLLGSIISGFFGRKVGVTGSHAKTFNTVLLILFTVLFSYLYKYSDLTTLSVISLIFFYVIFIHKFVINNGYNFNQKINKLLIVITFVNIILPLLIILDILIIELLSDIIKASLLFCFNCMFVTHYLQDVGSDAANELLQHQIEKQNQLYENNLSKTKQELDSERSEIVRKIEVHYLRLMTYKSTGNERLINKEEGKLISLELEKVANQKACLFMGKKGFNITEVEGKAMLYLKSLMGNKENS